MPRSIKIIIRIIFVVGLLNLVCKSLAYYITSSLAFYSDALESVINIISSFMSWYALSLSFKPADKNHRYGHHKAEYLFAIFEGLFILIISGFLLYHSYLNFILFLQGTPIVLQEITIGIILTSFPLIINIALSLFLFKLSKQHKSPTLNAEGHHLMSDSLISLSIIIAVLLTSWTQWYGGDALIAGVVGVFLLIQGLFVSLKAVKGLMDSAVSEQECYFIQQLIEMNAHGALEYHDLRTRVAGRVTFIEFHLVVPSIMSVEEAHKICDRIEEALVKEGYLSTIHIEPETHIERNSRKIKSHYE